MNNKKRIVVIGGAGFIGSNIVKRIKTHNNYEVVVLDLDNTTDKNGKISNFFGNFGDKELLEKILKKDDTVIHLAGTSIPLVSESDIEKDLNNNVLSTVRLLEVCGKKEISNFVFFSSGGAIYGDGYSIPIKETENTNPISCYGIIKLISEQYVKLFSFRYKFNYIILRPANLYGRSGDYIKPQGAVDVFLRKIINKENIEIWGNGDIVRDYIYIDDLVDLVEIILLSNVKNDIFNIGTGTGHSLKEIIEIIKSVVNKNLDIKYLENRNFDTSYNVLDINKVEKKFSWQPKYDLKKGIEFLYQKLTQNS